MEYVQIETHQYEFLSTGQFLGSSMKVSVKEMSVQVHSSLLCRLVSPLNEGIFVSYIENSEIE